MFQLLFLLLYCIYLSEIQFRFCSCFCIILNVDSNIKLCLLIFSCVFSFYYTGLKVKVTQSCPTLCRPMDNSLPGSSVCGILQARIYWSGQPFSSPGNLPNPRIKLKSPTLQADSLLSEEGKPKNTGVDSLPLLQRIFPTQGQNWSFLHCRQILYYLSYQRSPRGNHLLVILH